MKKPIIEEDGEHDIWYKEVEEISYEKLPAFIDHLVKDYEHDYGTIVHALAAGAIATIKAMNRTEAGSITGFQAGCVMWQFICKFMYPDNKLGLKLLNYDELLYPQYAEKFRREISKSTFEKIQQEARQKLVELADNTENGKPHMCHPSVYAHWQSIVKGQVPFGFTLSND